MTAPAKPIRRKQSIPDQAAWQAARESARQHWPDQELDNLIDCTVEQIRQHTAGKRAGFAWSGGKDSIALAHCAQLAGIEDCCLGMSNLEFPAFLTWVTDNMPDGLTVINTGQDLPWLANHPEMLFPKGQYGSRWFTIVNHRAQERYFKDQNLQVLLLGRRLADSNYTGPKGQHIYTNARGVTRYSPLAEWPHEAVFALIDREQLPMPPCYGWPRGFQVGTGSWPARQWTDSVDHGFEEVWTIDPDVVRAAADQLSPAREWMTRTGRT